MEDHVKTQEKMALYKPRGEASEETNPADVVTSDLQPLISERIFSVV